MTDFQRRFPAVACRAAAAASALLLAACGGGGGGSGPYDEDGLWEARTARSAPLAAYCAAPRSGSDPYNGNLPYPDVQGSLDDEKRWLRTFMDEIYLWYDEIPTLDPAAYSTAAQGSQYAALNAYFRALRTQELTASGKRRDAFSYTATTESYNAESESGLTLGYGMEIAFLATAPPRKALVKYSDPGTNAAKAGIGRGAEIIAIDGVAMLDGDAGALNAGLSPDLSGEEHVFSIRDRGASTTREVKLRAQVVTLLPVRGVQVLNTPAGKLGYLQFDDHIATSEGLLIDAITELRDAGVNDLVLDMRYNGGGFLDIASELAYMVAGPGRTRGRVFEKLQYNRKNPYGRADNDTPFHDRALAFDPSVAPDSQLPTLNLGRVFVLATRSTCSASESVINGLRGVDVQVVQIGGTTCGKPYGFYATDNCGTTYLAIEFTGANAKGVGNYADGFAPTCAVADDYTHELGDPAEAMLAAAIHHRAGNGCPVVAQSAPLQEVESLRSPLRENRIVRRPR